MGQNIHITFMDVDDQFSKYGFYVFPDFVKEACYDFLIADLLPASKEEMNVELRAYIENVLKMPPTNYFNSGTMVINCKRFREEAIVARLQHIYRSGIRYRWYEQDYLNMACNGRVLYYDVSYNFRVIMSLEKLQKNRSPYILHYFAIFKPWLRNDVNFSDIYWKYIKETDFYEEFKQLAIAAGCNRYE